MRVSVRLTHWVIEPRKEFFQRHTVVATVIHNTEVSERKLYKENKNKNKVCCEFFGGGVVPPPHCHNKIIDFYLKMAAVLITPSISIS